MTTVFLELGFVTLENGWISINEKPEKKSLEQSMAYRSKQEKADIENEFVYSSYHELKQWFTNTIYHRQKQKETV